MNHTKKILFLVPYPESLAPSQRYRFEQYLAILKNEGFSVKIAPFFNQNLWNVLYKSGYWLQKVGATLAGIFSRLRLLLSVSEYDWIFIHREAMPFGPAVYEWILAKIFQKRIVFDFDDAIWIEQTSSTNAIVGRLKSPGKTATICRLSHRVSAGNSFLAEFAKQHNSSVTVIPTTINMGYHNTIKRHQDNSSVTIGWTGTHSTLPYLESVINPLRELEKKHAIHILVIADEAVQLELKSLKFKNWRLESEVEDLMEMDIGLMPLPDTEWAEGKCGLKALQYLALGIPAVVSPVGVNRMIVDHGVNGFYCTAESDWMKYLEILIVNPEMRQQMGKVGRSKVEQHYSVKANKSRYLSLFND